MIALETNINQKAIKSQKNEFKYSQAEAILTFKPLIDSLGKNYKKVKSIYAREAKDCELIETYLGGKLETRRVRKVGEIIIKNQTEAGEE